MSLKKPLHASTAGFERDLLDPWDPKAPGRRLIEAARWALSGASPQNIAYARTIIEEGDRRAAQLIAMIDDPSGDADLLELVARSGYNEDHSLAGQRRRLAKQREIFQDLRGFADFMDDQHASGPPQASWLELMEQAETFTKYPIINRSVAFQACALGPLRDCIVAEDLERTKALLRVIARHAGYRSGARAGIGDITASDLHLIAAAASEPEVFDFAGKRFAHELVNNRDAMLRELRLFAGHRDPAEQPQRRDGNSFEDRLRVELPLTRSAADARAQTRGLLRNPKGYGPPESDAKIFGVRTTVSVEPDALAQLMDEDPDLSLHVTRLVLNSPGLGYLDRAAPEPAWQTKFQPTIAVVGDEVLAAVAHKSALVGDVRVEVRYLLPLKRMIKAEKDVSDSILVHQAESDPLWPKGHRAGAEVTEEGRVASVGSFQESRFPGDPQPRDLNRLAGPDECTHPGATWDLVRGSDKKRLDTAALSCPRCLRRRAALVPLHRMPDEFLSSIKGFDREGYLKLERVHAAIRGDLRPIESFEQIRERDGLVHLYPSAHATREMTMPKRQLPRSVAGAMSRR